MAEHYVVRHRNYDYGQSASLTCSQACDLFLRIPQSERDRFEIEVFNDHGKLIRTYDSRSFGN